MKKILLIVEGWEIALDDGYINSLDSKINDFKKKNWISNNDSEDHSNESNFSLIDKSDTRDNNLTLRLKGLGKRQVENFWFHCGCIIYYHLHSQLGNNKRIRTGNVYRLSLTTLGTWFEKTRNISIWLPIVKWLSFNSVIKSISISPGSNSLFQSYEGNITNTKRMMCDLKKYNIKILTQTKICVGVATNTHQYIRCNCKGRNVKTFVI